MTGLRLAPRLRRALKEAGLYYVVVRDKDVGVTMPGCVESAHSHELDARADCMRLCEMYAHIEENAFRVEEL